MSEDKRIDELNAIVHDFRPQFIDRPELARIRDDLRMLVERDNAASEGGVMTLMGEAGSGKTQFIQHFVAKYPRERHAIVSEGRRNDRAKVIVVPVTDTGIKGLSKAIYEQLAQAEPPAESRFDIQKAIYHYAKEMETKLIIFEESHDADSDRTGATVAAVARLFKQFSNKAMFSVLIVGTLRAKSLVTSNPELKRRNLAFHTLHPISWDDPASRQFFIRMLNTWDKLLGKALEPSGLGGENLAPKISRSSRGVIGLASVLIERAGIMAVIDKVRHGGTRITESHLHDAHDMLGLDGENPFEKPGSAERTAAPAPDAIPWPPGGRKAARDRMFRP
jgi:hypothetical protein